jgi:ABC-type transport system substrate-binding protein
VPRLEALRNAWFEAPDLPAQQRIAREMQQVALDEVVYAPLGSYVQLTGMRRNIEDRVVGPPLFWNIRRG